jgi:hypothetical protein
MGNSNIESLGSSTLFNVKRVWLLLHWILKEMENNQHTVHFLNGPPYTIVDYVYMFASLLYD